MPQKKDNTKYYKLAGSAESFTDPFQRNSDNRTLSKGQVKALDPTSPKVIQWVKGGGLEETDEKERIQYLEDKKKQDEEMQQRNIEKNQAGYARVAQAMEMLADQLGGSKKSSGSSASKSS